MSEIKHTPGPWVCYHDGPSVESHKNWHIITNDKKTRVIANVHIEPWNPMDQANAILIAAAPDMLEALQDLVQTLTRNMHTPLVKKCGGPLGRAIEAIAKATGGEA